MSTAARGAPPPPPPLDPRAHRALGGESRVRLLRVLRDEGPLDADEIAERVGLHLNTVRAHLTVLREAGLVVARVLPAAGPGRPRLTFAATRTVPNDGHPGADRLLAEILTSALQGRPDGPERTASAGRAAGRELVDDAAGRLPSTTERRARVLELLERLGFAPQAEGELSPGGPEVIGLHRCPFRDLAATGSPIVCSAHRGLLQGAFERLGGSPEALHLLPFVAPELCAVHLDPS